MLPHDHSLALLNRLDAPHLRGRKQKQYQRCRADRRPTGTTRSTYRPFDALNNERQLRYIRLRWPLMRILSGLSYGHRLAPIASSLVGRVRRRRPS